MSADAIDIELLSLIGKLNRIQREVGGGKKNDKKGDTFLQSGDKADRFSDLELRMNERVEVVKSAVEDIMKLEKVPGSNPKELISLQSTVRTELNTLGEEWKEMDMIYRIEKKKKRSRFPPEELTRREAVLIQLQSVIQNLKDIQRQGYVKQYQGLKLATMEESELFKKRDIETGETKTDKDGNVVKVTSQAKGVVGKRNVNMTDDHRQQLMLIKERDEKIDLEIEEIGKGVDELHELARQANQEIKIQNKMLDVLEEKVNDVHDNVAGINEQLKVTLEKARSSDKICTVRSFILFYSSSFDSSSLFFSYLLVDRIFYVLSFLLE
jgi:hypothetical protein